MKKLIINEAERNRILNQYDNSMFVDTSKFKKLLESKLGNVKPLITEANTTSCLPKLKASKNPGKQYYEEITDGELKMKKLVYYTTGAYYDVQTFKMSGEKYSYPKGDGEYFRFYCSGNKIVKTKEIVNIDGKPLGSNLSSTKTSTVPFKNNAEGNEFRTWVNQKYPNIAKNIDLDKIGIYSDSYNNEYIKKAWNYIVGNKTLGELYNQRSSSDFVDKNKSPYQYQWNSGSSSYESPSPKEICPKITNTSDLSKLDLKNKSQGYLNSLNNEINLGAISYTNQGIPTRTACQAALNKVRPGFRDKNQIIIDSLKHLIYVFDKYNNFIAKDVVITGADAQSKNAEIIARSFMDYDDKLKASGFERNYAGMIVDTTGKNRQYSFDILLAKNKEMGSRFLNPGIYTTSKETLDSEEYAGKENNVLSLKHIKGSEILQAIHGFYISDPNRVAAMKLAEKVISNPNDSSVSEKFLKMVDLKQINLSQSYGCINVPERFVPFLSKYMTNSYVFNISEDKNNYMVQNSENFFKQMQQPFRGIIPTPVGAEIPTEFDDIS